MNKHFLGRNIRIKRQLLGIKQTTLANDCQMSQSNLSQIEQGKIIPSFEKLELLAEKLNASITELGNPVQLNQRNDIIEKHKTLNPSFSYDEILQLKEQTILSN